MHLERTSEAISQILPSRFGEWLDVGGGQQRKVVGEILCMGGFVNSVFV